MNGFLELFQYQMKPLDKMSKKEIAEELSLYRALWLWIDEEMKAYLCHIRYPVAVVRRDYKRFVGLQGSVHFEPKSIEVDCTDESHDYFKHETTIETKTVTISLNQLVDVEYIHKEEVVPDEEITTEEKEPVELEELLRKE